MKATAFLRRLAVLVLMAPVRVAGAVVEYLQRACI